MAPTTRPKCRSESGVNGVSTIPSAHKAGLPVESTKQSGVEETLSSAEDGEPVRKRARSQHKRKQKRVRLAAPVNDAPASDPAMPSAQAGPTVYEECLVRVKKDVKRVKTEGVLIKDSTIKPWFNIMNDDSWTIISRSSKTGGVLYFIRGCVRPNRNRYLRVKPANITDYVSHSQLNMFEFELERYPDLDDESLESRLMRAKQRGNRRKRARGPVVNDPSDLAPVAGMREPSDAEVVAYKSQHPREMAVATAAQRDASLS